jgi:hypothetical protein
MVNDATPFHRLLKGFFPAQVPVVKIDRQVLQVVKPAGWADETGHLKAASQQNANKVRTNKASPTGDQDLHGDGM